MDTLENKHDVVQEIKQECVPETTRNTPPPVQRQKKIISQAQRDSLSAGRAVAHAQLREYKTRKNAAIDEEKALFNEFKKSRSTPIQIPMKVAQPAAEDDDWGAMYPTQPVKHTPISQPPRQQATIKRSRFFD